MIERIVVQEVTKKDGSPYSHTVILFVNGRSVYSKTSECSDVALFARVIAKNEGFHEGRPSTEFGTFLNVTTYTWTR